ncbi:MAG: hypothetical protein A2289_18595 [Deltaproteobacteria bacterium RIFOXYA12_FULL_58_15]|nr:MAG: hypothetical protein A2289_18595 [Deltaproteobacteria bacterium RIFOXYA12_FULL_58_15]OGR12842.1 MAG: hypothetical protein A2341_21950 [Deltaproteobacteria bacterium RIFOXYB12_FULL_58_9]
MFAINEGEPMVSIRLQVVIPFHQPLCADADIIAKACDSCYEPLLEAIESRPAVRVAVHLGGHLLDYLSRARPEFLLRLKAMNEAGQVEILGGPFYGGAATSIHELDIRGQIQMAAEYWESFAGFVPNGFWLPELAWAPEMPRLVDETGLAYGFVSSSQVVGAAPPALGVLERGGLSIAAYVLNAGLSSALPSVEPDRWLGAAVDAALGEPIVSAWVRAESLGLEPGTHRWCFEQGWLQRWLDTVSGSDQVEMVLPKDTFAASLEVASLRLRPGISTDLMPLGRNPGPSDWSDFIAGFSEVDSLYRRLWRVSDKLRLFIATMEEDGYEEEWSDTLATVQRLVFAAETPDAYWRGATPGFSDPALRDATMQRLADAESMMDALAQGDDDWIAMEEEERDGDLIDEVFVANRLLSTWIVPVLGGAVRLLEDRVGRRNLLDVGERRTESFFGELRTAPTSRDDSEPPRRGANLCNVSRELPTDADDTPRTMIREWLLEADATATEYFSGSLDTKKQVRPKFEISANAIDEEGDGAYTLRLIEELTIDGLRPRKGSVNKMLSLPIDAALLRFEYDVSVEGEGGSLFAIEVPLRIGVEAPTLFANGEAVAMTETELADVTQVLLESDDGAVVALDFEQPTDIWILPVRTTIRDLDGYREVEQGVVIVSVTRVEQNARVAMTLSVGHAGTTDEESETGDEIVDGVVEVAQSEEPSVRSDEPPVGSDFDSTTVDAAEGDDQEPPART